ncbi:hypothetical protein [uncultured Microbacterium sp.]|uniref:PH domain-containing protein n=1 Tax=uncultured Microbacterium sp. TaxID=191216 RepID=A0A1Y5PG31_9MICO|nr:hypothetical protein [uncultured Microbacterium sp.]SBS75081.1 conserved exported hypothetical protein [uncultured Microbacterium sp.]
MTREAAVLIFIVLAVVLIALGVWAWLRRARRDSDLAAPVGEIPDGARTRAVFDGLYVATTRHDEPLERLAIRGLGFRSRAAVTVTDLGVALDLTGQPRLFLPLERIASVGQATVAIDRVVEKDGLVRLSWHATDETLVDTYLRAQDASARRVVDAIAGILPAPTSTTPTGTDA